jgi:hypothetical protein
LSGHFGNWEVAISVFGLFGFPMGVVARDLENPLLDRWFRRFRQSTGHHLIGKKDFDQMTGLLEHGACFALLGDQDAGKGGLFVDFFDKPASTPKTIALLALEYDALICVGYARRLNEPAAWVRYELGCEDIIDPREIASDDPIREITQRYTNARGPSIARAVLLAAQALEEPARRPRRPAQTTRRRPQSRLIPSSLPSPDGGRAAKLLAHFKISRSDRMNAVQLCAHGLATVATNARSLASTDQSAHDTTWG